MSSLGRPGRTATMKLLEEVEGNRPLRRAVSNSSVSSTASAAASTETEDPFVFSPHQTPDSEEPSSWQASACASAGGHPSSNSFPQSQSPFPPRHNLPSSSSVPTTDSPTPRSRPIDISLPPSALRKIKSFGRTSTEPLSARGDVSGGYFPLHEDPEKRIHRPHPFHTATQKAKEDCDADALAKSAGSTHAAQQPSSSSTSRPTLPPLAVSEPKGQHLKAANMSRSQGLTPVTSYVPSGGFHESPMPVGKYYPSNYERRHNSSQNAPRTSRNSLRPPSARGPSSVKSDTAVPQFNRTDSHGRSDSEATRRLQQYQRDMVAQAYLATQKATQDLAGKEGAAAALAAASKHGAPLSRFQFPGTPHRPVSPRLEPMGSPGPVTPLALEGADGYWDRPRPVPSPDAGRESQAVARAMRAEGERHRREGQHSPAVEAGGFGF